MSTPESESRPGDPDHLASLLRWRWPLAVALLVAAGLVLAFLDIATDFPSQVTFGLDSWVDRAQLWMVAHWRGFFRSITRVLLQVLVPIEDLLLWLPWWLFMALVGLLAWRVRGYKFALLALAGLLFIGVVQMWDQAMRTLAVVGSATVMSVIVAVPVGIAMSKKERLNRLMLPILDTMQTMPSYVYLIPAIYFLGLGKVPAVVATMVYAVPPAMRLTNLGIRLVSPELKEAARAFGATPWQMLIKVELPLARPTIMAGINQTTMMALAMVVIASLVGAQGLGADVLAGIFNLEFGNGLVAGIGIVILAVIIDRITQGFSQERGSDIGSP
jgi:ABC-type proline/glycine betaine transport system permease subunit